MKKMIFIFILFQPLYMVAQVFTAYQQDTLKDLITYIDTTTESTNILYSKKGKVTEAVANYSFIDKFCGKIPKPYSISNKFITSKINHKLHFMRFCMQQKWSSMLDKLWNEVKTMQNFNKNPLYYEVIEELFYFYSDELLRDNNKIASILQELEQYHKSKNDYIYKANLYILKGYNAMMVTDIVEALHQFERVETILNKKNDKGRLYYVLFYHKALWYHNLGKYSTALIYIDKALNTPIYNDSTKYRHYLNEKISILEGAKQYDLAIKYQITTLKQIESLNLDPINNKYRGSQYTRALCNMGRILAAKGNSTQSLYYYEKGVDELVKNVDIEKNTYNYLKYNDAQYDKSDFNTSGLLERNKVIDDLPKFDVKNQSVIVKNDNKNITKAGRAELLLRAAKSPETNLDNAALYYLEALKYYQERYKSGLFFLPQTEKEALQTKKQQIATNLYNLPLSILSFQTDKIYDLQLAEKGVLLDLYQTQMNIAIKKSKDDKKVASSLKSYRSILYQYYYNKNNADSTISIFDIQQKEVELYKSLKIKEKVVPTYRDVQAALKPAEAAVEIITFPDVNDTTKTHYAALILTKNNKEPQMVVLPTNGKDMDDKHWTDYDKKIQNKDGNFEEAQKIYWQPIADALGSQVKTVWFSPDGVYHKINLALLGAKGKRVGDVYDLHIVATTRSIADVQRFSAGVAAKKHAVLFGNPDYKAKIDVADTSKVSVTYLHDDTNNRLQVAIGLPKKRGDDERGCCQSLPGAAKEVRTIAALLQQNNWQTDTFLLAKATEAELRRTAKPTVLHIATHAGYLIRNKEGYTDGLQSAWLHLAGAQAWVNQPDSVRSANAEGVLIGSEAALLDLQGTELVVLSACETGRGTVRNAEGVYGLQRAFRMAGAKAVLSTLWKVDDTATQLFMTAFYTEWLKDGTTKQAALRKAQLILQNDKRYNAPFYWGAFVLLE